MRIILLLFLLGSLVKAAPSTDIGQEIHVRVAQDGGPRPTPVGSLGDGTRRDQRAVSRQKMCVSHHRFRRQLAHTDHRASATEIRFLPTAK